MKLFSGSNNKLLSQHVADSMALPISKAEVVRFDNSEVRVRIEEDVKNEICVVIQSTSNPTDTNLMELFFFCDALKRQEARKVIGVIPYFGYARQDLQHREGECVSANVVIRFLESVGFDKIYTIDLHNEATAGSFSIPFKNISATPLLAEHIKTHLSEQGVSDLSPKQISIVIPDQGALEQGRQFGEAFFQTSDFPLSVVEKKRNLDSHNSVTSFGLYGDINGTISILVDDMVVSGNTLIAATDFLSKTHEVEKIFAAITHHDLTKEATERLTKSRIEKIFSTDTTQSSEKFLPDKMIEISVGSLVADELSYLKRM